MFTFSAIFYFIINAREMKTIIQHLQKVIPLSHWVEDILGSQIKLECEKKVREQYVTLQ